MTSRIISRLAFVVLSVFVLSSIQPRDAASSAMDCAQAGHSLGQGCVQEVLNGWWPEPGGCGACIMFYCSLYADCPLPWEPPRECDWGCYGDCAEAAGEVCDF